MDIYKKALQDIINLEGIDVVYAAASMPGMMRRIAEEALREQPVTVTAGDNCPACSGGGWCPRCKQRCYCAQGS